MHPQLKEVYSNSSESAGLAKKNIALKRAILEYLDNNDQATVADLSKEVHISSPKAMALVLELSGEGLITENGKMGSTGGRRASSFSLNSSAAFFLGVDVRKDAVNIGLIDFRKNIVEVKLQIPFKLQNNIVSFNKLVTIIRSFIRKSSVPKKKIQGIGMNLSGRVNIETGYSYSYFDFRKEPVAVTLEKLLGVPVYIDNDSRSMAYGEFCLGGSHEKNMLFINMDYGLGMGAVVNGTIYYGKSGYGGEIGHIPFFDNEIICHCGKKGCLETEASGYALLRKFKEKLRSGSKSQISKKHNDIEDILLQDVVDAALTEDVLAIELLAEVGEKMGKGISALVNIFNPELIILGGVLAQTEDYIRLPIITALKKYSINLVNNDAKLKMSALGKSAGVIGACFIARYKVLSFRLLP